MNTFCQGHGYCQRREEGLDVLGNDWVFFEEKRTYSTARIMQRKFLFVCCRPPGIQDPPGKALAACRTKHMELL